MSKIFRSVAFHFPSLCSFLLTFVSCYFLFYYLFIIFFSYHSFFYTFCWNGLKPIKRGFEPCNLLSSDRQHLSYDGCLEVRGEIIRTVMCCVLKLCTVMNTLRWAVLTVHWIGFCHTGPLSLWVDLSVFISVYFVLFLYCIFIVLLWAHWGGPGEIEAYSLGPIFLQRFDTVGWVIWPVKTCPRYNL